MPLSLFRDVESYESIRALYFFHLQSQVSSSYDCKVCDGLVELAVSGATFSGREVRLRLLPCLPLSADLPSHPVLNTDRTRLEADDFIQTRMRRCPALPHAVMLLKVRPSVRPRRHYRRPHHYLRSCAVVERSSSFVCERVRVGFTGRVSTGERYAAHRHECSPDDAIGAVVRARHLLGDGKSTGDGAGRLLPVASMVI